MNRDRTDSAGRRGGSRGFTLLEVLLAIALTAMLLSGVISFLWDLTSRRAALAAAATDLNAGGSLIERIEQDLVGTFAGNASVGAGVRGTATSLRLATRGVWIGVEAGEGDAAARARPAVGDVQVGEYEFEPESRRVMARRSMARSSESGSGSGDVVAERVERLRLRYFDGREWRTEFDSAAARNLPVAIEVAVWFEAFGRMPVVSEDPRAEREGRPWREPDRLRVIVVPDGPVTAWREGR